MNKQLSKVLDTAFINGHVITVDAEDTICEAVGLIENKIAIVGSNDEVNEYIGNKTSIIDLDGRTLMPGINDTHYHPILSGMLGTEMSDGMLRTSSDICPSLESMFSLIRKAVRMKSSGEWISMMGYEPELFTDEQRHPTLKELDDIAPENPVHCMHGGGHISMYNSLALEHIGIYGPDDASKYPDGEVEVVDGKLTGMLYGHTHFLLWEKVNYTEEQQKKAAMISHQHCLENGITSVGDMGECGKTSYHIMQKLTRNREFRVRVNHALHSIFGKPFSLEENNHFLSLGFMTGLGDEHYRIGPCKFMIDGGSGGPSCYTREPYSHNPTLKREKGWEREEVAEYIQKIVDAECQATAHAIGDGAVEYMVEGYERSFDKAKDKAAFKNLRHRIEHCTLVNQDLIDRMAAMNICPSVNAGLVAYLGGNFMKFYGERNAYLGALKSMMEAGIKCSMHSDYPSGPVSMMMIDGAVNRYDHTKNIQCDTTQAVSVLDAIRCVTYNAAYSTHEEEIKGSVEEGKLADLIVLSDNILEIDSMDIHKLAIDQTWIDGVLEYER